MNKDNFYNYIKINSGSGDDIKIQGIYGLVVNFNMEYCAIYINNTVEIEEFFYNSEQIRETFGKKFLENSKKTQFKKIKKILDVYK